MLAKLYLFICFLSIGVNGEYDDSYVIFQSASNNELKIADDNGYLSDKYYIMEKKLREVDTENFTYPSYGFELLYVPCTEDEQCNLINFDIADKMNSPIVKDSFCDVSQGTCSCGDDCVSRSITSGNGTEYYYCGPCGRIGTECAGEVDCTHMLAECYDGLCSCIDGGLFYDIYYCIIPYHGYERAIQLGIATCIFISVCLLLTTIYSTLYRQGRIHPYILRLISRAQPQGTQEAPPGDTPPQYDEVIANDQRLPTYQEALKIETRLKAGAENPAFDEQVGAPSAENSASPPAQVIETVVSSESETSAVVADQPTKPSAPEDEEIDLCPQYEYLDHQEGTSQQ